jgi:hypothetical protein
VVWFQLAQDMVQWLAVFKSVTNQRVPRKAGNLFTTWPIVHFGIFWPQTIWLIENLSAVHWTCRTAANTSKLPVKLSCDFEFLAAEAVKIIVRNMTPCSVKDFYQRFIGMCCIYVQLIKWGTMVIRKVRKYPLHYTASHSKRLISELLQSTYSRHSEEADAIQLDFLWNINFHSSLQTVPTTRLNLSQFHPCGNGEEGERSVGISRVGNEEILHKVK